MDYDVTFTLSLPRKCGDDIRHIRRALRVLVERDIGFMLIEEDTTAFVRGLKITRTTKDKQL